MLRAAIAAALLTSSASTASLGQPMPAQDLASKVRAIDAFVRAGFAVGATPGMGVAVAVDGRIVYTAGLGFADVDLEVPVGDSTLWYVASTSKSFTGFGIALLEAAGAVDLNAPITTLLPNARWHADARPSELTLASFLTHTHGLDSEPLVTSAAYTGAFGEDRYNELLAYCKPLATRELAYSNLGYNVAAMVIAAKRPEGWKAYLDREVFGRAGLRDIHGVVSGIPPQQIAKSHRLQPDGSYRAIPFVKRDITMNAAGGHVGSIRDLARWTILHMDEGKLDGRQVFPAAVVRRSHDALARKETRFAFFQRDGWAMGWDIGRYEGEPMVSRFGSYSGFRSHLSMLPGKRVGVVAQVNATPGWALTDIVAAYVYDLFLGKDADGRARPRLDSLAASLTLAKQYASRAVLDAAARQRPLSRPLDDFVGTFDNPGYGRITVLRDSAGLRARWGVLEAPLTVRDADRNRLSGELVGGATAIDFVFSGTGPADAIDVRGARFAAVR